MNELRFEWDEQKAIANEQKHNISFEEAESVFYDENARLIYDPNTLSMKSVIFFWE